MQFKTGDLRSVASGCGASREFDGFGQAPAHRTKNEGGHVALRSQGYARSLPRKLGAAVQTQPSLFEKLGRKAQVFRAVHTPKPEFLLLALQEVQSLFEFFHGTVEGGGQEKGA